MSLIEELKMNGYLKTPSIIKAFEEIKRNDFVRNEDKKDSEINAPLPIGFGQTISQPLTVAFMFELLEPKAGEKILDIGAGSGWTSALLANIVGEKGKIFSIEKIKELCSFAEINISKYPYIKKGIVKIICSNAYDGLPEYSPFDKIIASAAAPEIPYKFLEQLRSGGRLVMPVGKEGQTQDIIKIDKVSENNYEEIRYPGFVFVPLVK